MRSFVQFLIPLLILLALVVMVARKPAATQATTTKKREDDALPLPWLVLIILIGAGLSIALVWGLQS